jgi:hypothetical protein
MQTKVTRIVKKEWDSLYKDLVLRREVKNIQVPFTVPGIYAVGIYSPSTKQIMIAWPVDRPFEAQEEFAKKFTFGAFPVDEMYYEPPKSHLSLVKGEMNV